LHQRYGGELLAFLGERVEVLEGDVTRDDLGLDEATKTKLQRSLDLVINSSGLTEFNPDLRHALAINVDATVHLLDFLRRCDHAALMHLSTCYVAGARDGRISEELPHSYTPLHLPDFDAGHEWQSLHATVKKAEARAEGPELTEELRREALKRGPRGRKLTDKELNHHIRRYRSRWLRTHLTEAGTRRARELGWPNTYTFTKSLAESLLQQRGAELPVAVVRPSIVESSVAEPFRGWNEGVNTSGPLSYLLGTYFRQLPSNERKCLDLIPVDVVSRGMVLIAAALVERRHQRLYQLATSANNPCDMRRSIELTSLAHRKHYRARQGLEMWMKTRFDAIAVSKTRYRTFSAPSQKRIVHRVNRVTGLFLRKPLLQKRERELVRVEKMIELYEPFILHNEHVFEADNVQLLSLSLPPEERAAFAYDSDSIDWWDYWINIHVPALRRWCYPLLEGRPVETRNPRAGQPANNVRGLMAIFLTGSTGYIGGYIAAGLLTSHADSLNLLVRAKHEHEAQQRLWRALQLHFDFPRFSDLLHSRIRIFRGDLTQPGFGLADDDYRNLVESTGSVIHCAASLNRKSEKSCLNVNLRGTLEVVKLAAAARDHHGLRRFSHVSTVAVAGHRQDEVVVEDQAIDWNRSDYDPYARTKKFCEHMIHQLLPNVPRTIFRPSIVLGDSRRPETTQFDMVRAFVFLADLPLLPFRADDQADIVPVDFVAESVVTLHQKENPNHETYHLSSGVDSQTYCQLTDALADARGGGRPLYLPRLQAPFTWGVNRLANWRGNPVGYGASLIR
jgi:long-chain acyl-CoA synthetase